MNLWRRFRDLLPSDPLMVGEITADHADGTVTVTLIDGATLRVLGSGTVGAMVYVQTGRVVGEAPSLDVEVIEI
jgi:hypothetical protein